MKLIFFLVLAFVLISCGKDKKDAPIDYEYPQDLSHIQSSTKNGCFRLQNTYSETVYLFIDIENVEAIEFSTDEPMGTAHIQVVQGLTTDGRLVKMNDLVTNYKASDKATFVLQETENIKSLRVRGHSNYPYDGGGRQRMNINVYTTDSPDTSVLPQLNCDPNDQDPTLTQNMQKAFTKSAPYHYKFKKN